MKKILALILALTLLITGCAPVTSGKAKEKETRTITDSSKRKVELPENVQTIVCLGVGALRFTTYMDSLDLVVGTEQNELEKTLSKPYNYINNEYLNTLPVIGDNGEAYEEEIIKVAPDVIITSNTGDFADTLQEKLAIPVVTIPLVDNMFDSTCLETISLLGDIFQKKERAHELTTYIQDLKADLTLRTATLMDEDKPTAYVGGVSFKGLHGFEGTEAGYSPLTAIGARNIANDTGQSGPFNMDLEEILKRDPEIIFVDHNGLALMTEDYEKNPDYYQSLSAFKNGQVYSQISFRFSAVNIELALADAYYAGTVMFPQLFTDIDPAVKADEIFETFLGTPLYDEFVANDVAFGPITWEK
ncbi:iron complex transport system substrate-binding protein [Lachnospiraceae bacterium PF1-21]